VPGSASLIVRARIQIPTSDTGSLWLWSHPEPRQGWSKWARCTSGVPAADRPTYGFHARTKSDLDRAACAQFRDTVINQARHPDSEAIRSPSYVSPDSAQAKAILCPTTRRSLGHSGDRDPRSRPDKRSRSAAAPPAVGLTLRKHVSSDRGPGAPPVATGGLN